MTITNHLNSIIPELQELVHSYLDLNSALSLRQTSKENHRLTTHSIQRTHISSLCQEQFTEILRTKLQFSDEDMKRFKEKERTINDIQKEFLCRELEVSNTDLNSLMNTGRTVDGMNELELKTFISILHNPTNITINVPLSSADKESVLDDPIKISSSLREFFTVENLTFKNRNDIIPPDILFPLQIFRKVLNLYIQNAKILDDGLIIQSDISYPTLELIDLTELQVSLCDFDEPSPSERTFVYHLVTNSPNLKTLVLNSFRDAFEGDSIVKIFLDNFPSCQHLKNLHVQNTVIEDAHLLKIAHACPTLEYLDLRECPHITQSGIEDFKEYFQTLYPNNDAIKIDN